MDQVYDEEDLMRKVGALLAKAESTDNEHEASAFFEKAQELMVKHAIDEERVRSDHRRRVGAQVEDPVLENYMFGTYAHHAQAKSDLLVMIAKAHHVRCYLYSNRKDSNLYLEGNRGLHESQWTRLIGYKDDISHTKMLYVSLLIQSQKFAAEDWRVRYGEGKYSSYEDGRLGKFAWTSAHMEGFSARIGERFRSVAEVVYAATADAAGLMVNKEANIDEWMYENGLKRRPSANAVTAYVNKCYAEGFPVHMKPRKNSIPYYCLLDQGHDTGENPTLHDFRYKQERSYSSYSTQGRRTSYEGRDAGRSAADRADIGLSRLGNRAAIKG